MTICLSLNPLCIRTISLFCTDVAFNVPTFAIDVILDIVELRHLPGSSRLKRGIPALKSSASLFLALTQFFLEAKIKPFLK